MTANSPHQKSTPRAQVRALATDDIPQIAALHHRLMARRVAAPDSFFTDLFLESPFAREDTPSLVFENADGEIGGFLGVMPRTLVYAGKPIPSAFVTKFMVNPDARASMAALQLFRQFLKGPQILSYADILNDQGCSIFKASGGTPVPIYEFAWRQELRRTPSRRIRSSLNGIVEKCARLTYPALDKIAEFALPSRIPNPPTGDAALSLTSFDPVEITAALPKTAHAKTLRLHYEAAELSWLLQNLRQDPEVSLEAAALRDADGELVGWFAYHVGTAKLAQVLHLVARPNQARTVLDELFRHAASQGAIQISSRMEPLWLAPLSDRAGLSILHRRYSMAIHSKDPEVRDAFLRGEVMLTPLEGELSTQFYGERPPQ